MYYKTPRWILKKLIHKHKMDEPNGSRKYAEVSLIYSQYKIEVKKISKTSQGKMKETYIRNAVLITLSMLRRYYSQECAALYRKRDYKKDEIPFDSVSELEKLCFDYFLTLSYQCSSGPVHIKTIVTCTVSFTLDGISFVREVTGAAFSEKDAKQRASLLMLQDYCIKYPQMLALQLKNAEMVVNF